MSPASEHRCRHTIEAIAGHSMFPFMDVFSGYSQNKMDPLNAEKTSFWTPMGNPHYIVMSFSLKIVGTTYQRAMNAIFMICSIIASRTM